MNEIVLLENVEQKILVVRSQKVMMDRDLAELYGVETKVLIQAVKRNRDRFPPDFMFQLNNQEVALFEVTTCDLKQRTRRPQIFTLCLY